MGLFKRKIDGEDVKHIQELFYNLNGAILTNNKWLEACNEPDEDLTTLLNEARCNYTKTFYDISIKYIGKIYDIIMSDCKTRIDFTEGTYNLEIDCTNKIILNTLSNKGFTKVDGGVL